ncbi:Sugar transporter ERD6-like 16 [Senna tora]|uniref:Sugar transporter ERD6-like 16 n=1 Tax=Senna tora TaxID=362788 RepID=A0A834T0Q1_9FABA|nr:Sugar transporter ERD6-like 16 [Senna tora]
MAIEQYKDVEGGGEVQDLQEPFIQQGKSASVCKDVEYCYDHSKVENGSIGMVLLSTFVAVCGSFAFGTCVSNENVYRFLHHRMVSCLLLQWLVPCISLLVGLCFIPESPRWLAKVGHEKEFQAALRRLRGKDVDISQEAAEILDYIETLQSLPKTKFLDLFQSKHLRSVVIGVGLMVFQQFVGINGIGFYTAETFVAAGLSSGKIGTIAYACMQSHSLLPGWVPILAVAGVLMYVAAFSIGLGPVPWVIMSEIFPIHVKGTAGSLVVLVNWSGAWIVSYTFNFLMSWSSPGTLYLYAGFSLLTILFVAKLVPETKGKTLEEIQACINS